MDNSIIPKREINSRKEVEPALVSSFSASAHLEWESNVKRVLINKKLSDIQCGTRDRCNNVTCFSKHFSCIIMRHIQKAIRSLTIHAVVR